MTLIYRRGFLSMFTLSMFIVSMFVIASTHRINVDTTCVTVCQETPSINTMHFCQCHRREAPAKHLDNSKTIHFVKFAKWPIDKNSCIAMGRYIESCHTIFEIKDRRCLIETCEHRAIDNTTTTGLTTRNVVTTTSTRNVVTTTSTRNVVTTTSTRNAVTTISNLVTTVKRIDTKIDDQCLSLVQNNKGRLSKGNYDNQFGNACRNGQILIVECFLSHGLVDINMKWRIWGTPIMVAARSAQADIFRYLLSLNPDLLAKDIYGSSLLHHASAGGDVNIVSNLVEIQLMDKEIRNLHMRTPLLDAMINRKVEVVKYLMSQGCDVSAKDKFGRNCLHYACYNGYMNLVKNLVSTLGTECKSKTLETPVMMATKRDSLSVFKYLVTQKCNLNAVDIYNNTVLYYACQYDSINITKQLIEVHGVSIEIMNNNQITPCLAAAYYDSVKVFDYLAQRGCNKDAVDINGNNALHLCAGYKGKDLVRKLIEIYKFDKNKGGSMGRTPLAAAAINGNKETMMYLLGVGADPYINDKMGNNLLHLAAYNGQEDIVKYLLSKVRNYNVNVPGVKGRSAIMLAASGGHFRIFQFLLQLGANTNGLDENRNSLFHIACFGGNLKIVKMLLKFGKGNSNVNIANYTPYQVAKANVKTFLMKQKKHFT